MENKHLDPVALKFISFLKLSWHFCPFQDYR